jgi:hypothetical protein
LDWPLVGDATIFHFIAVQFQTGAVPYRDIFDINMPLIYYIHAAVVAIGDMSDAAWAHSILTGFYLMLVGVFAMAAASIKPSGVLLLLLPVFAIRNLGKGARTQRRIAGHQHRRDEWFQSRPNGVSRAGSTRGRRLHYVRCPPIGTELCVPAMVVGTIGRTNRRPGPLAIPLRTSENWRPSVAG